MKKNLFLLILFIIPTLWSCKRQNDLLPAINNAPANSGKLKSFSGGDGMWDLLGYGLDVTGDLIDPASISDSPIFNMAKFASDYSNRINVTSTTLGSEAYYSGATALDYMTDITNKKTFSSDGNNTPKIEGAKFNGPQKLWNGSLSKSSSDQHTTTYSSTYSYATFEEKEQVKRIRFTGDVTTSLLMNYLTPEFISNIATQSADELIARYGTHVMIDISIGGILRFNYNGIVQSESDYHKTTSDVKAGIGFGLDKVIGINFNADISKEEESKIVTNTRSKEYTGKYYGGTNSGRSVSFDKDGNSSETINLASWQSSVNANNAALIDVGKALYLYDFIADPTKKAQVKAAIEKHINDAQVKIDTDPVYQFYNSNMGGDHYTTADRNATLGFTGWRFDDVDFRAYQGFAPGTVPVYLFYNSSFDHFTTADVNATNGATGWSSYGIAFYAYKSQVAGTVPVYLYYNAQGHDHFTTDNPDIASLFPGWVKVGITFWAYPK